ncbi:PREDICTED: cysteine-rich DPF motif domain-containing protein 1 [Condylura cristata]|uniref:cysteine-rich DPF motif domain-containing protein 1 n=1 Tax=Condylura cristata TaxID=143302 RepID=UPI000643ADA8|nr:PREDICTED: cysteine-rich DPF motif domain-containing protein 1 [Condylura cristata]
MAWDAGRPPLGVFECQLCALTAPYSYVGQRPPDTQSVLLLEQSYVAKDPFSPDRDRFLVLGSRCSVCGRLVCVGPHALVAVRDKPGEAAGLGDAAAVRASPAAGCTL